MTWTLHPGAEQDLADAINFYLDSAGPTIAERFLDEFQRVARLLTEHPDIGTPDARDRRAFPLRVFPYTVVYRAGDRGLKILVVRHQHRRPGHGGARR